MTDAAALPAASRAGVYLVGGVLVVWLLAYIDVVMSAARVWWVSEIYSHCFFVLPASGFLIWRERAALAAAPARSSPWVAAPLALVTVLGVLAGAGSIDVLAHLAAFASLPLLFWLVAGTRAARRIWFPLAFVLFAVPVGDQLIPYLQQVTADMSVVLLQWTGVPVFRSGLYIDIPNGRFLVAEACSGVSFLIVTVAFGAFFAYVSYRRWKTRLAFMALALVLPIVANGVRVYGIILIGHLSDMRYATGVDHLVYGWVFFALVLACLIGIGNRYSDRDLLWSTSDDGDAHVGSGWSVRKMTIGAVLATVILLGGAVWRQAVSAPAGVAGHEPRVSSAPADGGWQPMLVGTPVQSQPDLEIDGVPVRYFVSKDAGIGERGELIASSNRLYDPKAWSLVTERRVTLPFGGEARYLDIVSGGSRARAVLYWYEVGDLRTGWGPGAKLRQALDVMFGGSGAGKLVALSVAATPGIDPERTLLNAAQLVAAP